MKLKEWLRINAEIGLLSFGASGRALLYEEAVVESRKALHSDEFQEVFTVAQVLPGPNLVNLSAYLGYRFCGFLGAVLGVFALAIPGALMLVGAYEWLGLGNERFEIFFKGVAIGSTLLFFILIFKMCRGLAVTAERSGRASSRKLGVRYVVAGLVTALALSSIPFYGVLVVGALLGLIAEFLW